MCLFVYFKQKTAYEMRISDWSSDVCSSDLEGGARKAGGVCGETHANRCVFEVWHPDPDVERRQDEDERVRVRRRDEESGERQSKQRGQRSEERRVGKEWVSTSRSRG